MSTELNINLLGFAYPQSSQLIQETVSECITIYKSLRPSLPIHPHIVISNCLLFNVDKIEFPKYKFCFTITEDQSQGPILFFYRFDYSLRQYVRVGNIHTIGRIHQYLKGLSELPVVVPT